MEQPERWLALAVPVPPEATRDAPPSDAPEGAAGPGAAGEGGDGPQAAGDAGGRRRAVTRVLLELGGTAVEEDEGELRTFLPPPDDLDACLERAREALAGAVEGDPPELRWRWLENRDWAREWRQGVEPRRVGRRLVVAPGWSDPDVGPDDAVIRIDPGMAFGTGEHGTTRGTLRLLERSLEPGDRVLDVGTGSGVLAVAAVRLGADRVVALDRDREAVRTARANLARNDVLGRVRLLHMEAAPGPLRLLSPPRYEVVAANLHAAALVPLLDAFRQVVRDDGRLITGGILEGEAEAFAAAAREAGWRLAARDRDEGWWTGLLRPPGG